MVQRWLRAGWIDLKDEGQLSRLVRVVHERAIYYRFIEGRIPDDQIPVELDTDLPIDMMD